jgi:hypothetical protein
MLLDSALRLRVLYATPRGHPERNEGSVHFAFTKKDRRVVVDAECMGPIASLRVTMGVGGSFHKNFATQAEWPESI